MPANAAISPQYTPALQRSAIVAAILLGLSALVLDGGLAMQAALIASLGYLGGVATATDLWVVRWGFAPLWLAAQFAVPFCWRLLRRLE